MKHAGRWMCVVLAAAAAMLSAGTSCAPPVPINPFTDLPPVPIDGVERTATSDILPLGFLDAGRVLRIEAHGTGLIGVLILAEDDQTDAAGRLAGGGPVGEAFQYRINVPARYFLHLQFDPTAGARSARVTIGDGDPDFSPPSRQIVQVLFAPDYLTNPGLFDPVDMTPDDAAFLASISDQVRDGILAELHRIFDGTPIVIIGPEETPPAEPFSTITFLPDRVLAEDQDAVDAALPPFDGSRPECQVRVTFGEVLPSGRVADPGNHTLDDAAVVYVGSFQGRGENCWSATINSVNNIVLSLAQTAAHEIGHLVGLFHVEQTDIMNRSATIAFQRELDMLRGQIQVDRLIGGRVQSEVSTILIQDPAFYFQAIFAP
jgi:hypothetical protein